MSRTDHGRKKKEHFRITVEYPNGRTKEVDVRAISREVAETRALKFHPNAIGVKR